MDRTWMPTVAGIVCIICGCLALAGFVLLTVFGGIFYLAPDIEPDEFALLFIRIAFTIGAIGSLIVGSTALFGGVSALQRRRWGWSLAGAIASVLICPPLGLAAIILVVMAESELRAAAA